MLSEANWFKSNRQWLDENCQQLATARQFVVLQKHTNKRSIIKLSKLTAQLLCNQKSSTSVHKRQAKFSYLDPRIPL